MTDANGFTAAELRFQRNQRADDPMQELPTAKTAEPISTQEGRQARVIDPVTQDRIAASADSKTTAGDHKEPTEADLENQKIDSILDRLNPQFDRSKSAYSENCTGVVQAYELQRRGTNAQPLPLETPLRTDEGGPGGRPLGSIEAPWGDRFKPGGRTEIEKAFSEPGSRGVVYIQWKMGGAHVFNVENIEGTVRFVDGQPTPARKDASKYFDVGFNTHYLRLDTVKNPDQTELAKYTRIDDPR
jgi:transcription antitermination factor NusG